jgi:CRISPR-associated protein Cas1
MKIPGVPPAELADLNRAQDRLSFIYLERCLIHRDSNAITATDDKGVVHIPPPPSASSCSAPAPASPNRR